MIENGQSFSPSALRMPRWTGTEAFTFFPGTISSLPNRVHGPGSPVRNTMCTMSIRTIAGQPCFERSSAYRPASSNPFPPEFRIFNILRPGFPPAPRYPDPDSLRWRKQAQSCINNMGGFVRLYIGNFTIGRFCSPHIVVIRMRGFSDIHR